MIGPLSESLAVALRRASSRLDPPPTPIVSIAVHVAVLGTWVALFLLAFGRGGIVAWSIGLAYLGYDIALQVFTGWQIRRISDRVDRTVPRTAGVARPSVAVIVAAHNEAAVLPATLAALLGQTDAPEEVLIADDGSADGTAEMLCARFGFVMPESGGGTPAVRVGATALRWLRLAHGGKAAALNAALLQTAADLIITVDADTVVGAPAIGAVRSAFSVEPELVAVTGVITPGCRPTPVGRVMQWFQTYEYIRNFTARYAWMRIGCLQLISGAFAGFRRDAVYRVGGFDSCMVEDYELVARMYRFAGDHGLDWRFRVLAGAQARTEAPASVPGFLRQRRRWFGGFLQTQWWYRGMVGDPRFGRLGMIMLPIKAFDTVQPLFGLTAFGLLIYFVVAGRFDVVGPVLVILAVKLAVDVLFHLWVLGRYRRWVGDPHRASIAAAAAAMVVEPLTFTLLLQTGAILGWIAFLGGSQRWDPQIRFGVGD